MYTYIYIYRERERERHIYIYNVRIDVYLSDNLRGGAERPHPQRSDNNH